MEIHPITISFFLVDFKAKNLTFYSWQLKDELGLLEPLPFIKNRTVVQDWVSVPGLGR